MRKLFHLCLTLLSILLCSVSIVAQNNFFTDAGKNRSMQSSGLREIVPTEYRSSTMNVTAMRSFLWSLPAEAAVSNRNQAPVITLPMPDGTAGRFRVWESSLMHPALAAKFPEMKTFAGQGIDDPYATIRLDYNPYFGFHAQILSPSGRIFIDPYAKFDIEHYQSYYSKDYVNTTPFACETIEDQPRPESITAGPCRGTQLYTYRLALACTGEYAVAVCAPNPATIPVTSARMLTSVNRVVGVYEQEVAVRMVLVPLNDLLIYLDGTTDPYTNNSGTTMLSENQGNIDGVIGAANYDIGHVFSTGGGGVAQLSSVCGGGKARGVTGSGFPIGDGFDIDYVAHEMGHQFGGRHTFNSTTSSCSGNRSGTAAYEVGSGTTIQAYAGICGSDNIQPNSDPFFHTFSFDEISNFLEASGASCRVVTPTGNTLPVITAMSNNNVSIPISTPFTLSGSATDADGDALTYCWEEWDLGPSTPWNGGNANTTSPLFKSRAPKTNGSRTFPDISVIAANYPAAPAATMGGLKGEILPTQARVMKFRLTVRDNRASGGGVVTGGDGCQAGFTSMFQVNVVATAGPFAVTVPNGGESYLGGTAQTVTWDVVGTTAAPFNVANVRITLSTDGGLTYPTELIASTPNDGSELISLPVVVTSLARIRVEALGNIFFDISNANFSITAPPVGFDFNTPAATVSACPAPASLSTVLGVISTGGFTNAVTLSASGNPAGTTVSFTPNPVIPGNNTTVSLNGTNTLPAGTYTITVTGTATGAINKSRDLVFTINPGAGPTITAHPGNQAVCIGGTANFSVTAASATAFQWQVSTDGGTNYSNITNGGIYSGATTATLTITGVTAGLENTRYRVVASVLCGSTTSNPGILTINAAPAITTHPQSITICANSSNTFTVSATGAGLTYQWEASIAGCAGPWAPIAGATSNSYTVNPVLANMNNMGIRVVVSGTCAPSATSNCALVTVITPVTINTHPVDVTVCSGSNAVFSVAATSTQPVIYQWQSATAAAPTTFTDIAGANASTYTVANATAAQNGNRYRVLVSNATCSATQASNAAVLTVRQLPTVTLTASSNSLLPGQTATLTATPSASTGGVLSTSWLYNGGPITNTGNTRTVTIEQVGTYQVTIQEVFAANGITCTNQSQQVVINAEASTRLFIFPSPNQGTFTVSYYNSAGTSAQRTVTIYAASGAKIYHKSFAVSGPYTLIPVDIRRAARGIYFVVIGDASGKKIAKGNVVVH